MEDDYGEWHEAAQAFEAGLAGLRKSDDGWIIEFSVSADELPQGMAGTALRPAFRVVTFELDHHSRPIPAEKKRTGKLIEIAAAQEERADPPD